MYEIDEFGCWVLPQRDLDLIQAHRYYKFAIICAEELSDELCYEKDERYFNTETYVRWYEAVEKALVIWLYYLGLRLISDNHLARVHKYHEEVIESLGSSDNPFWGAFRRRDLRRRELLPLLRRDMKLRNQWHRDHLPVQNPFETWEELGIHLRMVNDALEVSLTIFDNSEWEAGLGPRDGKLVLINTEWNPGKLAVKDMDEIRRRFQTLL